MLLVMLIQIGHANNHNRILKLFEKGDFQKAEALLLKNLAKDSTNFVTYFLYSKLYFNPAFASQNVDTSLYYWRKSEYWIGGTSKKSIDKYAKNGIDTIRIFSLKAKLDSAAFQKCVDTHTILGYNHFLNLHYDAEQIETVKALRNELAFDIALSENTWQAFEDFMATYPVSEQYNDAKVRYERLLFEDKTKSKSIDDYRAFLLEFPETPYRNVAERAILEISTLDNHPNSYLSFLREFPYSYWRALAYDLLYFADFNFHYSTHFKLTFRPGYIRDSLLTVEQLNSKTIFPFAKQGKYGFMDKSGKIVLAPIYDNLAPELFCGAIDSPYLIVEQSSLKKIINRVGTTIYQNKDFETHYLGGGLLMIDDNKGNSRKKIMLLSGKSIFQEVFDDAYLAMGSLLILTKDKKKALYTILGKKLTEYEFDNIEIVGNTIVFEQNDKLCIFPRTEVVTWANSMAPTFDCMFEDVILLKDSFLLVATGNKEALYDANLKLIIKSNEQRIIPLKSGWKVTEKQGQWLVLDGNNMPSKVYKNVLASEKWYAFKDSIYWQLRSIKSGRSHDQLDSVALIGDHAAIIQRGDELQLIFDQADPITLKPESKIEILGANVSGHVTSEYYLIKNMGRSMIVASNGKPLFAEKVDQVSYLLPGYFETRYQGLRGIIDSLGRFALETKYQAVEGIGKGKAMILQNGKFGLIDLPKKRIIGTDFEERLIEYNGELLIAKQNGKYGLISQEKARRILPFQFNHIEYWSDSLALVKINTTWSLAHIYENGKTGLKFLALEHLPDINGMKRAKALTETGYNILVGSRGLLFKDDYKDIFNIGTMKEPVYLTEKWDDASQQTEICYWDQDGLLLLRQLFSNKEYLNLFCED